VLVGEKMALLKHEIPILEFDNTFEGLIHAPHHFEKSAPTPYCVLTFFKEVIDHLVETKQAIPWKYLTSTVGKHPIYLVTKGSIQIALIHPMLGGPYAAGIIEELIALGFDKFIACGGAGVLDKSINVGHLIIPSKALRAEGTSYHYLAPSRYVEIQPDIVSKLETSLQMANVPYMVGTTWTTDAFYRETKDMIQHRKNEGCICVEMECASFAAVCAFRNVMFGQILYGGDDISSSTWDSRKWNSRSDVRHSLVDLCFDAVASF
jgi:uridine phosphorylase